MSHLRKETVLVLNRSWQAIHTKSPMEAFTMMYQDSATALDIRGVDVMVPLRWKDWVNLPYDENANYIKTINGEIKIPTVIVLCEFNRVPMKRPKFTSNNLWERDQGTCQYTNKKLSRSEANIDHVVPRTKGGKTNWTNCVICHKEVNAKKGPRTPEEAGLKLIRQPSIPRSLPSTFYIRNKHNVTDWDIFLKDFSN
jgi:5-methylcytosine-specific restriction endonuclease McrA